MPSELEIIITMRYIQLNIMIPGEHFAKFEIEFGIEFATQNDGVPNVKPVDSCTRNNDAYHVQVSVQGNDEERFFIFLRNFCTEKSLTLRDSLRYDKFEKFVA